MRRVVRHALAGAAALLAGSALLLRWWDPTSDESTVPPPAGLAWRTGSWQQYDVRVDSSMRMHAGAAGTTQRLTVRVNAALDLLTLETDALGAWVGMRLSAVELSVGGNSDSAINQNLAEPFRVRFSAAGMPETFEFPGTVAAPQREILENLVRTFQVTMQAGATWVAAETNATGRYEADYRQTAPSRIEKSKRNFVGHPTAPTYSGAEVASTETFDVDPQRDWLVAMTVDETVRTTGGGGPALEIENHATLSLRSATSAAASRNTWSFTAAGAPAVRVAANVPSLSPAEARAQIRLETAALDRASDGRMQRVHRLRDLLRVDAAMPAVILELLQTQQLADRTRADLYLALELADTEAAQAALTSVLGNPAASLSDGMRAIVALTGVERPTPATVAALWNTALNSPATADGAQLASTATLGLGSLGSAMRQADDPDYTSLRTRLLGGALTGAGTAVQRANHVHAVGNTRDASLASDIVVLLDDPAPEVRRAAALSLGRLDADRSATQLVARFRRESDNQVRGAIAESLVSWTAPTEDVVTLMRDGVGAERDENTRFNMARFVAANLAAYPESRTALEELLRVEQSRRIRQSVAEALAAAR